MSPRLVIITGLSGAGRTEAMRVFEDLGYFCVDNLPPSLIPKFAELIQKSAEVRGAALVMDVRGGTFFKELQTTLEALDRDRIPYQILYLEADEEVLIRRYKMSRRRHPLQSQGALLEALRQERQALEEFRGQAHLVIDTSHLAPRQLQMRLAEIFRLDESTGAFQLRLVSFGFKHGLPKDSDLVLDVRFLPNPFYVESLRPKTGEDPEIQEYVMRWPVAQETFLRFQELLDFLVPQYQQEGKPQVILAVGCTGGRHRSVVFANLLAGHFKNRGHMVTVEHRDLNLK